MRPIFCVFLTISALPLLAGDSVSLPDAVKAGLSRSPSVQSKILEESRLLHLRRFAEKRRLPSFTAGASYQYQSERMVLSIPEQTIAPGITSPGLERSVGTFHTCDVKVGLTQPLYTGGRLKGAVERARLLESIARNETEWERAVYAGEIKASFFRYLLYKQKKTSMMRLHESLSIHLTRLEKLYQEGLAPRSEVLEARKRMGETEIQLDELNHSIESEAIHFHRLCGIQAGSVDSTYQERAIPEPEAGRYFRDRHPFLRAMNRRIELACIEERITRGKYLPELMGYAEFHYGRPGINMFEDQWMSYAVGGVRVSMSLFNWNQKKHETAVPQIARKQIEQEEAEFTDSVNERLDQLYARLDALDTETARLERMIEYARDDAALKARLYEENQIPHTDYLAAMTEYEKYESMRYERLHEIQLTRVSINTLITYQE
jgi:outer membrane protein TolC